MTTTKKDNRPTSNATELEIELEIRVSGSSINAQDGGFRDIFYRTVSTKLPVEIALEETALAFTQGQAAALIVAGYKAASNHMDFDYEAAAKEELDTERDLGVSKYREDN